VTTRILVVEDEAIIASDIRTALTDLGYTVPAMTARGDEAVRLAQEFSPSLVLMDIQLKGPLDGVDAAREIKARLDVPVVFLTSHSDEATLERAMQVAPHGYLLKPFEERELRTAIEVALHQHDLERLHAQRERWFSTTLRSIGDAVVATDAGGHVTFMNPVAETLTGWQRGAAVGKTIETVFQLTDDRGLLIEGPVRQVLADRFNQVGASDSRLMQQSGDSIAVDVSAAPIIDDQGELLGAVLTFRDVTERKRLERRVNHAERLATLASLSAGMGHEINSPLAAIIANVSMSLDDLTAVQTAIDAGNREEARARLAEVAEMMHDTLTAGERIKQIVVDLRKLSSNDGRTGILDLPIVIEGARRGLADLLSKATVIASYSATPYVEAREHELAQVFTQVLSNAALALPDGVGRIEIRTFNDEAGRAVVEIKDFGVGIPEQNLPRVFDAFFTTRQPAAGMGLGLAICHRIVSDLGGEIFVDSAPGEGTIVRVAIPPARRPEKATLPSPRLRKRVLVIDDELEVARVIARVLERDHDVVIETDPRAAVMRLSQNVDFDLVFCDLHMPWLSGRDVYQSMSTSAPQLRDRFVFVTGVEQTDEDDTLFRDLATPVLHKPFTVDAIRMMLKDLFG
jgi:PAS domain S-box-containing protein